MNKRGLVRRGPLLMSFRRRMTLYAVSVGIWLSGILWLVYHYFLRRQGPFGFTNNPLEHWWLVVHGAFSFAAIWMFGLLWSVHITTGWWMRWRRRSGGTLVGVTTFLVLTGYALYYLDSEQLRSWTSILHWGVGIAALAIFIIHRISKTAPRTTRQRRNAPALAEPIKTASIETA